MSEYIDNTPKKENKKESKNTNLGETEVKMNAIKPIDSNRIFQSVNFTEVGFPTSITTNVDTNTYDVLADTKDANNSDDSTDDKESDNSDNESIDIDEIIFKDHINIAFVSTLSLVGLFILFRMIQKSR
jgi:hypothetical protein